MEFKFKKTGVSLADGIDANKFGALRAIAVTPEEVKKVFLNYGYNLEGINGAFLKTFSLNAQELKEVENNLAKIEKMGMKTIFQANLQVKYFKNKFMSKLERCMSANLPYLNSDNTFASFFDNDEEFEAYISGAKIEEKPLDNSINRKDNVIDVNINNNVNKEDRTNEMTPEDKQVYNEIVEKLNYLVLGNPLDTMLVNVVRNATTKVVDAILRQEYKFLGIREMVESVMFDGLDVTPEDNQRLTNLVLGAFPDEERKMM